MLQLDDTGTAPLLFQDTSHRYLWNPQAVDYLLADEQVDFDPNVGVSGDYVTDHVYHALGDNQNTIRDVVEYSGGTTLLKTHRLFDSFGDITTETYNIGLMFDYTGRPRVQVGVCGLQWWWRTPVAWFSRRVQKLSMGE